MAGQELFARYTFRYNLVGTRYGSFFTIHLVRDADEDIHAVMPVDVLEETRRLLARWVELFETASYEASDELEEKLLDLISEHAVAAVIGRDLWQPTGPAITEVGSGYTGYVEVMYDGSRVYWAIVPDLFHAPLEAFDSDHLAAIPVILLAWRYGSERRGLRPRRCGNSVVLTAPPRIDEAPWARSYIELTYGRGPVVYFPEP